VSVLNDAFPDLTDCFYQVSLFELCEGPVSVSIMSVAVVFFCLEAYLNSFSVKRMHVVNESEIIVRVRVSIVNLYTLF